ncbi:bifunctional protein-disulfide isomerase/oxidoreductase DsbC [Psychromonas sp. RZ22]|uniref:bifunctional protein-disulfide isomerase/oxidoreductase DsbC n=1 Tax=Psychromonas algarum TaxID=2555643 RepID=UPI0010671CAF|nr:bifunctional protein-disulfide isomerase/oxidoreductase DsbC [Psychromonas sp. RZ22]TEW55594.1 bifunctional protein-disulfide isomerase/oxidoreductase DsbC [Psychromonas sp. RZ22]
MSMLSIKKSIATLIVGLLVSTSSFAAISKEVQDTLNKKLHSLKVNVTAINESPVKGLYEVVAAGAIYYISEDGKFLINGNMYDLDNNMKNLTGEKIEQLRRANTAEHFAKMKDFEKDMIVYKADNEKYVVTVFTDTSCGYCQKLHSEMADYNKAGITIRYLAFPRGGVNSSAYHTMVSVWCSEDPKLAMDNAKHRRSIPPVSCDNTVKEQYELGVLLGVNGTPALFFEDGTAMPGYLPADRLLQVLKENEKK